MQPPACLAQLFGGRFQLAPELLHGEFTKKTLNPAPLKQKKEQSCSCNSSALHSPEAAPQARRFELRPRGSERPLRQLAEKTAELLSSRIIFCIKETSSHSSAGHSSGTAMLLERSSCSSLGSRSVAAALGRPDSPSLRRRNTTAKL